MTYLEELFMFDASTVFNGYNRETKATVKHAIDFHNGYNDEHFQASVTLFI